MRAAIPSWYVTLTACTMAALLVVSAQAQSLGNPWTPERARAVVRIEVTRGAAPVVGTGFVVKGLSGRHYVLTSTHVVLPEHNPADAQPSGCIPLLNGTRLFQGNSGGPELRASCAHHLGYDTSIAELAPRDDPFPVLELSARELAVNDPVTLAGFPLGYPRDTSRSGKITTTSGPDGTIVTDILTAEGMSGGPYLTSDGVVVGIHRGGGRYTAGFAHMTPIFWLRNLLERFVGPIPTTLTTRPTPGQQQPPPGLSTTSTQRPLVLGERTVVYDAFQRYEASAYSFQSRRVVSWGVLTGDLLV
jgi:S1-C subfamily serine protease